MTNKQYTTKITRFDGGMTTVLRNAASNEARLIKHFDNFSKKHALIPYVNTESNDGGSLTQATNKIQNFLMYGSKLYGLGVQTSDSTKAVIFENTAPQNASWAISSGSVPSAQNTTLFNMFKEYQGIIYYSNAQGLGSYNISGASYNETARAIAGITSISQGLVHSKDSIFYFGYTTSSAVIIGKYDNSTWTNAALTISTTNYKVIDLCEYGNYIAIALQPTRNGFNSVVLLWDRDSSVSTLSEAIDWGNNTLYAIENIDGYIIGVAVQGNISNTAIWKLPKLIFKQYGGGGAVQFKEIQLQSFSTIQGKQKINNRLYFAIQATSLIDSQNVGTTNDYSGVWSVGRSGINDPFTVNFDRSAANSGVVLFNDGSNPFGGFIIAGDYVYISHYVSSTATLTKSNSTDGTYSAISTYESPYFATVDSATTKKLIGVTLTYEKIPTSGSVSLYYRADGSTSWTLIFTDSTATSTSHDAVNIESTGVTLPQYSEIEFQIISKGVTITGLFFTEETIDNALY